jgi:hypothetical protein
VGGESDFGITKAGGRELNRSAFGERVSCLTQSGCFAARDFRVPRGVRDESRNGVRRSEQRRGARKERRPFGLLPKSHGASLFVRHPAWCGTGMLRPYALPRGFLGATKQPPFVRHDARKADSGSCVRALLARMVFSSSYFAIWSLNDGNPVSVKGRAGAYREDVKIEP